AVEAALVAKNGDDGKPLGLKLVTKRAVALGASPKAIEMSVSGRATELHVLAYAVHDVAVDVLQGTTPATTMRSPLQREPTGAAPAPPARCTRRRRRRRSPRRSRGATCTGWCNPARCRRTACNRSRARSAP